MNAETVNTATKAGRATAEAEQLDDLTKIYLRLITAAGRRAAEAFRQQTALVAATDPTWVPPATNLIDADQLTADAKRKTAGPHEQILRTVTAADVIGIDWTIAHPTSQMLLASVAARLDTLNAALRLQVSETIQEGFASGWSVAQTAAAIVAKVDEVAPARAAMYARTDLNALSNGGSLMAAQIAGVAAKTWLTAGDDKVRETHADAEGQTVPIEQPFDIGGEQAMYPGDPDLSDEEALNCRCTLIYGDTVTAASVVEERQPDVVAGSVPFRLEMPPQKPPVARVTVEAPQVTVHNEMPAIDVGPLEQVLEAIVASSAAAQRGELAEFLTQVVAAIQAEQPAPQITVAAADVAPPDLSGIAPSIVDGLSPAALELVAVLRELLAAAQATRTRRVSVIRDRSGEITDLLITDE